MNKYTICSVAWVLVALYSNRGIAAMDCANLVREPINLSAVKEQIKRYYDLGAWDQAIQCMGEQAKSALRKYMPIEGKKFAVIFDIDETALSNWDFFIKNDFCYDLDSIKEWEFSGKSKAIQGVLDFYNFAKENGFALFFISGRRENQRKATVQNLKNAGFNGWTGIYLRTNADNIKTVDFKSKYRSIIQDNGYTIVLSVGDQQSDFQGEPAALNNIKIPNPVYMIP